MRKIFIMASKKEKSKKSTANFDPFVSFSLLYLFLPSLPIITNHSSLYVTWIEVLQQPVKWSPKL